MIIDGRIFYLINLLTNLKIASVILSIVCAFIMAALFAQIDCTCNDEEEKQYKKLVKVCLIIVVVSLILIIVIPTKETMYQMLVCKYITRENINLTINQAKELVDYIVTKISEIK